MRISSVFLVLVVVFVAFSFSLQIRVNAQTTYITVYGQLTQFQCPVGAVSGPCTGFNLTTNGTTPGIPNSPMLDFSQSVVPVPAQSDVSQLIMATGYYGQESGCDYQLVNSCPAFFVHTWGPYYRLTSAPTTTGYFSSSNPPTTNPPTTSTEVPNLLDKLTSSPWIPLALILVTVVAVAYFLTHRKH